MDDVLVNARQSRSGLLQGSGRQRALSVALPLLLGVLLRVWWVLHYGQISEDSHVYGELARNVLEHHVYGYSNFGKLPVATATLIRLPGYPAFLGVCFRLFGMENYTAVMLAQMAVDLWTCLLVAGLAARIFGRRAGLAALWLAALCPFTANYVAAVLTETLTLFCIALAFYAVMRWKECGGGVNRWVGATGFALAYAILLRPEQGILAAAVVPAMFWIGFREAGLAAAVRTAVVVSVLALLPLVPWMVRNWRVFHVFQPLAPRFAVDPWERNPYGFQRWYRTWAVEFASTDAIYWPYMGQPIAIADLPNRAFDSNAQYEETEAVFTAYNEHYVATPAIDAAFNQIAEERIHADPIRYYAALPVGRVLDMMFRPRTEILPVPVEWWKVSPKPGTRWFALAYAGLNAAYFGLAGWALWRRRWWEDEQVVVWAMLATIMMRTLLLLTIDNSEPRYTLEFFPVLMVLGSAVVARVVGELERS